MNAVFTVGAPLRWTMARATEVVATGAGERAEHVPGGSDEHATDRDLTPALDSRGSADRRELPSLWWICSVTFASDMFASRNT